MLAQRDQARGHDRSRAIDSVIGRNSVARGKTVERGKSERDRVPWMSLQAQSDGGNEGP